MKSLFFEGVDIVMRGVTALGEMKWLWGLCWLGLMIFGKKKGRRVGWLVLSVLLLTDGIVTHALKPFFARPRPPFENYRMPFEHLSVYGFPSNHAANIGAVVVLLGLITKNIGLRISLVFVGLLVCYSRVYLRVHYPSDVIAGALFGGAMGGLGVLLAKRRRLLI